MIRQLEAVRPVPGSGYPTGDGKPMSETDLHRNQMVEVIHALQRWYAGEPEVYVTGNLLLFYEKGNKRRHISPDCFVAFGIPNHEREHYLLWEEVPPSVAIEITSKSTRAEDTRRKKTLYCNTLKIKEYYLFDPLGDYLEPTLQGYRLRAGNYVAIRPLNQRVPSLQLGLHLEQVGHELRFWNPVEESYLPTDRELFQTAATAQQRLGQLEQEVHQLREQLARQRDSLHGQNGH